MSNHTVLGLDPGIGNTGWSIVALETSHDYRLIDSGYRTTLKTETLGDRLDSHYITIHDRLMAYTPDLLAIEAVYFNKNISSCISTASVIAIAELAAFRLGIPTQQFKPQTIKAAVTGSQTASKATVKRYVNNLLSADIKNDHEADAAAVAVAGLLKLRSCNNENA